MKSILTRQDLFDALCDSEYNRFYLRGYIGYVLSVEREDGSGRSFNVRMNHNSNGSGEYITEDIYVRFEK